MAKDTRRRLEERSIPYSSLQTTSNVKPEAASPKVEAPKTDSTTTQQSGKFGKKS